VNAVTPATETSYVEGTQDLANELMTGTLNANEVGVAVYSAWRSGPGAFDEFLPSGLPCPWPFSIAEVY
jgi:hypothetical protein